MEIRKTLVTLFLLLFNERTDTSSSEDTLGREVPVTSTPASLCVTKSEMTTKTTIYPCAESETDNNDLKTTGYSYITSERTPGEESEPVTTNTNNAIAVENKTESEKAGLVSSTATAKVITESTQITKSTSRSFPGWNSAEDLNKEENELLNLMLNVSVTYCQENMCDSLKEPPHNCRCDDLCYFYNDCCYPMIEKLMQSKENEMNELAPLIRQKIEEVEGKTFMLRKDLTACVGNEYNATCFIMVSKCDAMSMVSKDVIEKCELSNTVYSVHNIPVDHIVDGKVEGTFKNVFCALCNGVSEKEIEFWTVDISCNVENVEEVSQMKIDEIEQLEKCVINPKSLYKASLRRCYFGKMFVETCDRGHTSEMRILCQSYVYPGTIGNKNTSQIYKNPHCASCHEENADVRDFLCKKLYHDDDQRFKPGFIDTPVNLQVVFDFSSERGLVSKIKCVDLVKCEFYEIYDCASKQCRQVYCQRGEIPYEGNCIKTSNITFPANENLVMDTLKPIDRNVTDVYSLENIDTYILEVSSDNEANLVFYALGESSNSILKIIQNTIKLMYQKDLESHQLKLCPCLKIKSEAGKYDMINELFQRLVAYFKTLEKTEKRGYSLIPLFLQLRNFHSLENLECTLGKLITDSKPSVVTYISNSSSLSFSNMSFLLPSFDMVVYEQNSMWEMKYNAELGLVPEVVATCDIRPNLNCSMLAYEIFEVTISNTSVKIINTSLSFQTDEIALFQNKVFVCANRVTDIDYFVNIFEYSAHHRVLPLVTSAVSAFSAAIVVVAHCCMRRLRNIHGLNLSALALSITLMHLLLIFTYFFNQTFCLVYAVVLHFVILNVFMWMNIIGYDMTRNLSSDKPFSLLSPYKRFLGYIFLSLVFPTAIITVSLSLDYTVSRFKPDYGKNGVCWLSNGKSILLFVIGPIVVSLLLNFSFFIFTIKSIYSKAKQSRFARNRSYFVVYLKLSLILGLTWILGIVSAFAEQEWLWIVHIVINGLHGLSLLTCSLVNVRMLRQLRNSLKSSENSYNSKSGATENSNI